MARKQSSRSLSNTSPTHYKKIVKFFIGLLLFGLILTGTYFFKITQVSCIVAGVEDDEFCQNLSFLYDQPFFFTNLEQTPLYTSTLINQQGQVFEPVAIKKKLPGNLIIIFEREDPWYKLEFYEELYVVNSRGYLAQDSDQFKLPIVKVTEIYLDQVGSDKVETKLHQLISQFVQAFLEQDLITQQIILNQNESLVQLNQVQYLFDAQTQPNLLAMQIKIIDQNLDIIRQELTSEQTLKTIDMRFELPVVK